MGEMRFLGFLALFLIVLFIASSVYSLSCVGLTQSVEWDDVKLQKGNPAFFTTKVLNSSSGTGYCEQGYYTIELSLQEKDFELDEIFDWNVDPATLALSDNDSAPVLITLIPKVEFGKFVLLIRATRTNSAGGTKIMSASTAKMNITVGDSADPRFSAVPFWRVRKDCPGGFVVRQDEECPRLCESGQVADEQGKCPEDKEAPNVIVVEKEKIVPVGQSAFFVLGGLTLSFESFILIVAVIVAVCIIAFSLLYIRSAKQRLRGGLR